jgi:hypothetical protein
MQLLPIPVLKRLPKTPVPLKTRISLDVSANFLNEGHPVNLMQG